MLAVGCAGPFLLNNVIGRNAKLINEAILREIINGYTEVCEHLQRWGINIIPAGGETADCGDLIRTLVVDSTLVCTLKKSDVIDCSKVKPNQVIIGFSSYGQTNYESSYNSGVSTNGFTFLRHELLNNNYGVKYPEILCPEVSADSYQGKFSLETILPGGLDDLTLGEALLSPTRTYMPFFVKIPSELKSSISAIFHNTGGGLTKCLSFGKGISFIKDNLFDSSPLFSFIRNNTQTPFEELCQILNMGHRLEIVCDKEISSDLIAIANDLNLDAKIIGQTKEKQGENSLTVHHEGRTIEFNPG
ncbi:MAG: phosphoribosylformylglycinamidine cyclo-ligase [Gammaproteobacteria bacterium]